MADLKTHLRELSVLVGIYELIHQQSIPLAINYTPKKFYKCLVSILPIEQVNTIDEIKYLDQFDLACTSIITNGFKLAEKLKVSLNIDHLNPGDLKWEGLSTQSEDPTDILIKQHHVSLKEQSYIIENMGLYKYLSLVTTQSFKRGLHIFEEFAAESYMSWFLYTWSQLERIKDCWVYTSPKYDSSITRQADSWLFTCGEKIAELPFQCTLQEFKTLTDSKLRERVFSKWINQTLKSDDRYQTLKKTCSCVAGEQVCKLIMDDLDHEGLMRMFRVQEFSYYFAKTTEQQQNIYKVPSQAEFEDEFMIESVTYKVPQSQLNIETVVKNTVTDRRLKFRSECRFSHGQFNGTPEAKMYYDGNLITIYQEV